MKVMFKKASRNDGTPKWKHSGSHLNYWDNELRSKKHQRYETSNKTVLISELLFSYLVITCQHSSSIYGDCGFSENTIPGWSIWEKKKKKTQNKTDLEFKTKMMKTKEFRESRLYRHISKRIYMGRKEKSLGTTHSFDSVTSVPDSLFHGIFCYLPN